MSSDAGGLPRAAAPSTDSTSSAPATATPRPRSAFHSSLLELGLTLSQPHQGTQGESHKGETATPYTFYTPTPETHAKVLHRLVRERQRTMAIERVKSRSRSRYGRGVSSGPGGRRGESANGRASDRGRSVEPRNPVDEGQVEQDAREASRSRPGGAVDEATQAIFRDKLSLRAEDARGLWGWSMPVQIGSMEKSIYLADSDSPLLARESDGLLVPKVRLSNLYLPSITPRHASDPKIRKLLVEEQKKRQLILYAHSSFPTSASDAVFFGPDTYRFLSFLSSALADLPAPDSSGQWKLGVDVGTGAGAGALAIAGLKKAEGPAELDAKPAKATKDEEPLVARVLGMDINPKALEFAEVNGSLYHHHSSLCSSYSLSPSGAEEEATWGDRLKFRESDLLQALTDDENGEVDLIISNPPYIAFGSEDAIPEEDEDEDGEGSRGRTRTPPSRAGKKGASYADGGSSRGLCLPLTILHESLKLLRPGGLCLLYTGVPVNLNGHNPLRAACEEYNARAEQGGVDQPLVSQAGDLSLENQNKTQSGGKGGSAGGVRARLEYWTTIDADVFGDELADPTGPYGGGSGVGRIEVVGVGMRKL